MINQIDDVQNTLSKIEAMRSKRKSSLTGCDGTQGSQDENHSQERQHWQLESAVFEGEKKEISAALQTEKPLSEGAELFFWREKVSNHVTNVTNVTTLDLSTATNAETENLDNAKAVIDAALLECADNPGILAKEVLAMAGLTKETGTLLNKGIGATTAPELKLEIQKAAKFKADMASFDM